VITVSITASVIREKKTKPKEDRRIKKLVKKETEELKDIRKENMKNKKGGG